MCPHPSPEAQRHNIHILPNQPDAPGGQALRFQDETGRQLFAYPYPKASISATIVVYDEGKNKILLIVRGQEPFCGEHCFPGGFLDPGRESLEQTALRELEEEAGLQLKPEALQWLDVRSALNRDPRDHVVDVGFVARVQNGQARAGDDAAEVHWWTPEEIDKMPLAFDHGLIWQRARVLLFGG